MVIETKVRSIMKTISWRFTATLTTTVLVYIFTGQIETAIAIGTIEVFAKMLIYYVHERAWHKTKFGKKEIQPSVVWITGLPASGKRELSLEIRNLLEEKGFKVEYLDGAVIRSLVPETGFSKPERVKHIQKVGQLAQVLEKNGTFVVANFVSPDLEARKYVRGLCKSFFEIHVTTPQEVCESRDDKKLYQRGRSGELDNVVGVHFEYEVSPEPELSLNLNDEDFEKHSKNALGHLEKRF